MKKSLLLTVCLVFSFPAHAWICGYYGDQLGSASRQINDVNCSYANSSKALLLSCSVSLQNEDANKKYNVDIYVRNNAGKVRKMHGEWKYRGTWYFAQIDNFNRSVRQFDARWVVRNKRGGTYYQSPWTKCTI